MKSPQPLGKSNMKTMVFKFNTLEINIKFLELDTYFVHDILLKELSQLAGAVEYTCCISVEELDILPLQVSWIWY